MQARAIAVTLVVLALQTGAPAQEPPRYRFQAGNIWQYRVQQTTRVTQTIEGETNTFESSTELVKRWEIKEVGSDGAALIQLTIPELKLTQKLPNGKTIVYDSTQPQQSHPSLRAQMEQFVGKPTVLLKVGTRGQVVEAKPLVPIASNQYATEPPFGIVLPETALLPGHRWQRPFQIVLNPPIGTGEKYDAEHHYEVRSLNDRQAEITFVTQIRNPPSAAAEKIPLLQKMTRGVATYDLATGRVTLLRVQASGSVEGHEGASSKYEFFSEYVERLQP